MLETRDGIEERAGRFHPLKPTVRLRFEASLLELNCQLRLLSSV